MTDPARPGSGRTQRGQAVPLALVVVLLAGVVALGLARVGTAVAARARAQAAADAVALAAAADPAGAGASEVAAANGARIVEVRAEGDDVVVQIERRGAAASARARWVPVGIP